MSDDANNAPSEHQPPDQPVPRRAKITRVRKLTLGLIVCGLFFAMLEVVLLLLGVAPVADNADPFAGFSNRFPLFSMQNSAAEPSALVTVENRLAYFNRQSFSAEKPANGCRVFCLGGSTTYGRPYDDQTSFSGFMREALPELDPGREWEVVNAGGISYGSFRIALLMLELAQYEPDVFILYTGHNEFLEDLTYASMIETPETVRSMGGWAAQSRVFSVAHQLANGDDGGQSGDAEALPDEVDALLDRSIGPGVYHRDEAWWREVVTRFQTSLEQIITLAEESGAKVILVTPASSLQNCEPFKSEHRDNLTGDELRLFTKHLSAAGKAFKTDDTETALQQVIGALKIDDRYAAAHYLHGQILLTAGDAALAREAFRQALEEDVCPLRARTRIVDIVLDVADRRQLPLVDFAGTIDSAAEHNIPGADWFLDHVHPTIAGHRLLASKLCDLLVDIELASARDGWGPGEFDKVADRVEAQIDPAKHAVALRNLAKVLSWAGKTDEGDRLALMAIEQLSDDTETQSMAGFAAFRKGHLQDAEKHFNAALEIDPNNAKALNGLGNVLSQNMRYSEARDCFKRSLEIDAGNVSSWFNLGNVCRELGQLETATNAYLQALSLEPNQPDAQKNLGLVHIAEGNLQAAIPRFQAALKLEPGSPERHAEMGLLLIDAGDLPRAANAFKKALSIAPNCVPGLIGTALVAEQEGDTARAIAVLRRATEIAPDDAGVRNLLSRLTR